MSYKKSQILIASLILYVILSITHGHTSEVDHYLFLGQEIEDSSNIFNKKLNDIAQRYIARYNKYNINISCEKLATIIGRKLYHGTESFALKNNWIPQLPNKNTMSASELYKQSIYNGNAWPGHLLPLGHIINYSGIRMGTDKLAHFIGLGWRLYEKYLKLKKEGLAEKEINSKLIAYAIWTENSILGKFFSSVFSYGDLEADWQGFLFMKTFCEGDNPKLVKGNGRWKLNVKIDLKNYVNAYFNEMVNPSGYMGPREISIRKNMQKYCSDKNYTLYRQEVENYTMPRELSLALETAFNDPTLPKQVSLEDACTENW